MDFINYFQQLFSDPPQEDLNILHIKVENIEKARVLKTRTNILNFDQVPVTEILCPSYIALQLYSIANDKYLEISKKTC